MTRYKGPSDFCHDSPSRTGVLLCNLGSPEAPTAPALRRYLAQFLWDPRVIEMPRPLWWLILHGVILRVRPKRSAAAYASVWNEEGEGGPLLAISRRQRQALQARLEAATGGEMPVALAMRYGRPAIAEGLAELERAGCRRVLVLPLYPQYSATTTASVFDAVVDELKRWRWVPELRFVNGYHDDEAYVAALAASIAEAFEAKGRPDRLIFSFHGMPERYLLGGDPYFCHCHKTARLAAAALGLEEGQWQVTFQSRFGREKWLTPYTDETLKALPGEGVKRVAVVCPAFSADCLETLEEIAVENREIFLEAGGERFHYIPALNDRDDHMEALAALALRHMGGWLDEGGDDPAARRRRAEALGARC